MQLTLSRQPTAIAILDATFAKAMPRELSDLSNRENTADGVNSWQWRLACIFRLNALLLCRSLAT
jgi:hypothetical protein